MGKTPLGKLVIYVPNSLTVRPACAAFIAHDLGKGVLNLTVLDAGTGVPYGIEKAEYHPKGELGTWHFVEEEPEPPTGIVMSDDSPVDPLEPPQEP